MSRLRVALSIINPVRNLPGIVLTAFELCQRGVTCFITPFKGGQEEVFALAPDFVLLPAIGPFPFSMTLQFIAAGVQFGFVEAETALRSSIRNLIHPAKGDLDILRRIACFCCWSYRTADHLIDDRILSREKITVTGCPRFDYYVDPLAEAYRKKTLGSKPRRKTVFIDTNLAVENPYPEKKAVAAGVQPPGDLYCDSEGLPSSANVETVQSMADLACLLAGDFPSVNILFRSELPELNQTFERDFAKHPNLRLANAGNTVSWVLQSAAVIQRGSSSAFDANLAQTPALSPQWIAGTDYDPIAEDVSVKYADYSEFRRGLGAVLSGTIKVSKQTRNRAISIIEDTFYKVDGLAHQRVATGILESVQAEIKPNLTKCRHYFSQLGGRTTLRTTTFPNRAGDARKITPGHSFADTVGNDPVSQKAIEKLVEAISEAKSAERPKTVNISSANRGGAYVSYQYRGRAVMLRCD